MEFSVTFCVYRECDLALKTIVNFKKYIRLMRWAHERKWQYVRNCCAICYPLWIYGNGRILLHSVVGAAVICVRLFFLFLFPSFLFRKYGKMNVCWGSFGLRWRPQCKCLVQICGYFVYAHCSSNSLLRLSMRSYSFPLGDKTIMLTFFSVQSKKKAAHILWKAK